MATKSKTRKKAEAWAKKLSRRAVVWTWKKSKRGFVKLTTKVVSTKTGGGSARLPFLRSIIMLRQF